MKCNNLIKDKTLIEDALINLGLQQMTKYEIAWDGAVVGVAIVDWRSSGSVPTSPSIISYVVTHVMSRPLQPIGFCCLLLSQHTNSTSYLFFFFFGAKNLLFVDTHPRERHNENPNSKSLFLNSSTNQSIKNNVIEIKFTN